MCPVPYPGWSHPVHQQPLCYLFLGHKRPDCLTRTLLCTSVMKAQVVPVPQIFWAFRGPRKYVCKELTWQRKGPISATTEGRSGTCAQPLISQQRLYMGLHFCGTKQLESWLCRAAAPRPMCF